MRWFGGLFGLVLMLFVIAGIGYVVYDAGHDNGYDDGVADAVAATADEGGTVIVRDHDHRGGFFPFGFFGVILGWFLLIGLLKLAFFRGWGRHHDGHGPWGRGPGGWRERARQAHDEWHAESSGGAGSTPAAGSSA